MHLFLLNETVFKESLLSGNLVRDQLEAHAQRLMALRRTRTYVAMALVDEVLCDIVENVRFLSNWLIFFSCVVAYTPSHLSSGFCRTRPFSFPSLRCSLLSL